MRRFTAELAFLRLRPKAKLPMAIAAEEWIPACPLQRLERSAAIERLERFMSVISQHNQRENDRLLKASFSLADVVQLKMYF
jgi:hypothetical protein